MHNHGHDDTGEIVRPHTVWLPIGWSSPRPNKYIKYCTGWCRMNEKEESRIAVANRDVASSQARTMNGVLLDDDDKELGVPDRRSGLCDSENLSKNGEKVNREKSSSIADCFFIMIIILSKIFDKVF
ncbi:hypothetical protein GWI33_016391 [Rhynchophorus ferrugineus]|uniref:Uncharacterized protein n=1 Tax=Rhynchophorus ferrugineus TaxID=354439 RepID=A0A834I3N5_RHYFE|nr:hypothetical protein GWI33_016391 [Rhynchophorus ferrugineus]